LWLDAGLTTQATERRSPGTAMPITIPIEILIIIMGRPN